MDPVNDEQKIPVVVGVTGHRDLRADELPAIREAVRKELRAIRGLCPHSPLVLLSALAEGADQLCAEIALEEGYALSVPLPMPLSEYAEDFSGEALDRLYSLADRAREVFVVPDTEPRSEAAVAKEAELCGEAGGPAGAEPRDPADAEAEACREYRNFRYRQADIYVAEHCHVLLALWDGTPGKPGGCGAAETVDFMMRRSYRTPDWTGLYPDRGRVIHIPVRRRGKTGAAEKQPGAAPVSIPDVARYGEDAYTASIAETDRFNENVSKTAAGAGDTPETSGAAGSSSSAAKTPPEPAGSAVLRRIDGIYDAANERSVRSQKQLRTILACLSASGTIVTMAFLLYDEMEQHWMILLCGVFLLSLFGFKRLAERLRCHKDYLGCRLLAEGLRVQKYLYLTGTKCEVPDLLPWFWQVNLPWTSDAISAANVGERPAGRNGAEEPWIRGQLDYHRAALARTEAKLRTNSRILAVSLTVTILSYFAALIFELHWGGLFSSVKLLPIEQLEQVRTILKILLGSLSAATLFAGNYYGKLSLDETADDHRRMIALYEMADARIGIEDADDDGPDTEVPGAGEETDEDLEAFFRKLAREELNENSSWFSYQSINTPDIGL